MKKSTPKALILSGYGLNCEEETAFAFEYAGVHADIVHLKDLIDTPKRLSRYQILAIPGGFSFGDHTGSGRAFANKLTNHLSEELAAFVARDTLTIGICNGFQILTECGLLPGALTYNAQPRYLTRWLDVAVRAETCPWLSGIERLALPIAHGEGRYYLDESGRAELSRTNALGLQYVAGAMCEHFDLPHNPNGSLDDIAGVTAQSGRVFGLMPHPERALLFTQLPHYTYERDRLRRGGQPLPERGPGYAIFANARRYYA